MKPETASRELRHELATARRAALAFLNTLGSAVVGAAIVVALLLGVVAAPQPAHAQDASPAVAVSSHDVVAGDTFAATVSFDPVGVDVGAVSLLLRYDATSLEAQACTASGSGLCHLTPDGVRLARVDTARIEATAELITVDFVVLATAVTSELTIDLNTVATIDGDRLSDAQVSPGLVTTDAPEAPVAVELLGGLNGEVLDSDGAGVFAAQVCATDAAGQPTCTETTGLGAFAIDGLASGDYSVTVTDPTGVLASASFSTTVAAPDVTTGLSTTLVPAGIDDASAIETPIVDEPVDEPAAAVDPAGPDAPAADPVVAATPAVTAPSLASLSANPGEIVVRVVDAREAPISGADVCATAPVVGTQGCGATDVTGVVRLSELPVDNYVLTAIVDPELRFDSPEPVLVGLNRDAGVVAELVFADEDLGDPPEALAYVNPTSSPSTRTTALVATGLGVLALTAMARFNRRADERIS